MYDDFCSGLQCHCQINEFGFPYMMTSIFCRFLDSKKNLMKKQSRVGCNRGTRKGKSLRSCSSARSERYVCGTQTQFGNPMGMNDGHMTFKIRPAEFLDEK
jgi:hypothetical protein